MKRMTAIRITAAVALLLATVNWGLLPAPTVGAECVFWNGNPTEHIAPTTSATQTKVWIEWPWTYRWRVDLSAVDNLGGVGFVELWWKAEGAQTIQRTFTCRQDLDGSVKASFSISRVGTTTVRYWALDGAGNSSVVKTITVRVDPDPRGPGIPRPGLP